MDSAGAEPRAPSALLLVDEPGERRDRWCTALEELGTVRVVDSARDALQAVLVDPYELVVTTFTLSDGLGTDLLRSLRQHLPNAHMVLASSFEHLPDIVRSSRDRTIDRTLALPLRDSALKRAVSDLLSGKAEWTPATAVGGLEVKGEGAALTLPMARELFEWTAICATRQGSNVLRPLDTSGLSQLQIVLDEASSTELAAALPSAWGPAVDPESMSFSERRQHSVLRLFGRISARDQLFCRTAEGGADVYCALLGWRREPRVTLVLGVYCAADREATWSPLIAGAHRIAIESTTDLRLPSVERRQSTGAYFSPTYNWVVSKGYVGPDRRDRPTTFLNRYVFIGRRYRLPSGALEFFQVFVDRVQPWAALFAGVYVVLSAIDTTFTVVFIRYGSFEEANPLWRSLVHTSPFLFVLGKNAFSLASLAIVVRFQLLSWGKALLGLNLFLYLALDAYWLFLLLR